MTPLPLDAPDFTRRYLNLADPRLGAEAMSASDDFFAPKERMLNPEPAIFVRGNTMNMGNGWTGGRLAGNEWPGTIGALCGSVGRV
jgi:allantoicase